MIAFFFEVNKKFHFNYLGMILLYNCIAITIMCFKGKHFYDVYLKVSLKSSRAFFHIMFHDVSNACHRFFFFVKLYMA